MNKILPILSALLLALPAQAQRRSTYLAEMMRLKERFDATFVYESSLRLDGDCRSIGNSTTLSKGIADLFKGSDIDYEIRGHTVVLRQAGKRTVPDGSDQIPAWAFDTLRPSRIESTWVDTLAAAVKTDRLKAARSLGTIRADMPAIRGIVSPLGEGDPLRWVQTLPGVASGADGSSALYVRGGNLGNNLLTLDGVPVYGYSHILGLTTIVPPETIGEVELSKGGLDGSQGNFTSAHLRIRSKTPDAEGFKSSVALNNFLASASAEGRMGRRGSYIVSGRISPLALEYKAFRSRLVDYIGSFEDVTAGIGDVYGKLCWDIGRHSRLEAFALGSMDSYGFTTSDGSKDEIGWDNAIGSVGYIHEGGQAETEVRFYADRYTSMQKTDKYYRESRQDLSLTSRMAEYALSAKRTRHLKEDFSLTYGLKLQDAYFTPGQVGSAGRRYHSLLSSAWLQGNIEVPDKLSVMAAVRGDVFSSLDGGKVALVPDGSLSVKWFPLKRFSIGATLDRTSQFYHTLEGLPVGWSIDMVVPSSGTIGPETAFQANLETDLMLGRHSVSAGAFHKRMEGLVYYKYAPSLFSGALSAWEDHVDTGQGYSYGVETQYEYLGDDLQARVSYTWSRTWREGFASVLDGGPFHARFDRRHVLHATVFWKGFNAAFTFQSGHWENGAARQVVLHKVPGIDEEWTAEYFAGENDYHMPDILRLDIGYRFTFEAWGFGHEMNLGICNVTNHFNPFMLYFNGSREVWEEIALLPILPNFSYRIRF